jgi:hypothetical protein
MSIGLSPARHEGIRGEWRELHAFPASPLHWDEGSALHPVWKQMRWDSSVLECDAGSLGEWPSTFRRNVVSLSSESSGQRRLLVLQGKRDQEDFSDCLSLKIQKVRSFETSGTTHPMTRRHILQDLIHQLQDWENVKSCKWSGLHCTEAMKETYKIKMHTYAIYNGVLMETLTESRQLRSPSLIMTTRPRLTRITYFTRPCFKA